MADISDTLAKFFNEVQEVWDVTPKPVKVFLYVTVSGIIVVLGSYVTKLEPNTTQSFLMVGVVNAVIVAAKTTIDSKE